MEFLLEGLGYLAAVLIGLILGLMGGGGSILTVPVLVYLFQVDKVTATAYSLFIVGIAALIGAVQKIREGLVSYKTAVVFAIPAFVVVFLTRKYLVPAIPDVLFSVGDFVVTKGIAIMIFFAILMILAAISMIRSGKNKVEPEGPLTYNYPIIFLEGVIVGLITGVVGAGGGFIIIPALVLLVKLPMKVAVGTSLVIIAAKSLIGFLGDLGENAHIDWNFLMIFSGLAVVGIIIGNYLNRYINGPSLKKGFGWFVLAMGILVIVLEVTSK